MVVSRTVSADPGLLSPEELLASHKGGRRKTLEQLIAEQRTNDLQKDPKNTIISRCRAKVQWFLDGAHLKISVCKERNTKTSFVQIFFVFTPHF